MQERRQPGAAFRSNGASSPVLTGLSRGNASPPSLPAKESWLVSPANHVSRGICIYCRNGASRTKERV